MKKLILITFTMALIICANSAKCADYTGTPSFGDFSGWTFIPSTTQIACVVKGDTCYVCGNDTYNCSASICKNRISVPTGTYQTFGYSALGCMGSAGFCVAPYPGIYIKDGGGNTDFYIKGDIPGANCVGNYIASMCNTSSFSIAQAFGYAMCLCNASIDYPSSCEYCHANYYGTYSCSACPCMTDINGAQRCGTSPEGSTKLSDCKMSAEHNFPDTAGSWHFATACPAS